MSLHTTIRGIWEGLSNALFPISISLVTYTLISYILVALLITYAVATETSLFSVLIYLVYQKISLLILGHAVAVTTILFGFALLRATMGRLRDLEVESLDDAGRTMIVETLLFLVLANPTVNGTDVPHGLMFLCVASMLGIKILHFIAAGRTTHLIEAGLGGVRGVLLKLSGFLTSLIILDIAATYFYHSQTSLRSNFYMYLLFEFCGLLTSSICNLVKLAVVFVDVSLEARASDNNQHGWPLKNEYILLIEVCKDVVDLVTFLVFLISIFMSNPARLPLYLANDLFQIGRTLILRISAFVRYRRLTARLDDDFPDATLKELFDADNCIICRDLLTLGSKKLPCGHVLHLLCLRSWFVHHHTCPTCRAEVKLPSSKQSAKNATSSRTVTSPFGTTTPMGNIRTFNYKHPFTYEGEKRVKGVRDTILKSEPLGNNENLTVSERAELPLNHPRQCTVPSTMKVLRHKGLLKTRNQSVNYALRAIERLLDEDQRLEELMLGTTNPDGSDRAEAHNDNDHAEHHSPHDLSGNEHSTHKYRM